jgi:cytochrome c biogenesis protein CcmG/thiol:disulfide interchange protein DsbE
MELPHWFWSLLAGALLMLALAGVSTALQSDPAPQWATSERASDEAPNFSLKTLSGDTFRLNEHRGKVVVLNFWGTWCPPCREEIPMFVKLQRELGDEGLQFVGVALERSAGPEEVRAFTQKMDMNYPVGLGDGSIARKYGGVRGLPMTFIIGPDGIIQGHIPGMATESMLRPGLEKLLKTTTADG